MKNNQKRDDEIIARLKEKHRQYLEVTPEAYEATRSFFSQSEKEFIREWLERKAF